MKLIVSSLAASTLHRLYEAVPSDTGIIVLDEYPGMKPNILVYDEYMPMQIQEPIEVKKKRKDYWNDLPRPKRRKR